MAVSVRFHRRTRGSGSGSSARRCRTTPLEHDHDRHAVHLLGAGRRGRDAAVVPPRRAQRAAPASRSPTRRTTPTRLQRLAAMARAEGFEEVVIGLTYSISDGAHARVLRRAGRRARRLRGDGPALPQGSRRPAHARRGARARAALPAPRRATRPLELHSHCTIGLAPLVYVEGVRAGFQVRAHRVGAAVARDVAARGDEHACATSRRAGYSHRLDLDALGGRVGALRASWPRRKGLPAGAPQEFDAAYYHHQLAGRHGHDDAAHARGAPPAGAVRRGARGGRRASAPRWATRSSSRRSRSSSRARRRAT